MFYIFEIQDGTDNHAVLTYTAETKNAALSKYHEILMYASISSIERHTCIITDNEGKYIARETILHPKEITPVVNRSTDNEEVNNE